MMLFFKYFSQLSLLTITSLVSSFFIANLSAKAATFSLSESILVIDNFSVTPQNPSVESNSKTVTSSGGTLDLAEANAEVNTIFQANSDSAFLSTNLFSDAFGDGKRFFGVGESSSFAVGNFWLQANQTLSFDFVTTIAIFNQVDTPLDGSASGFSGVNFLLLDENSKRVLGDFTAIGNVDTNLAEDKDDDFIFVDSSNNVSLYGSQYQDFEGNTESAELFLEGSFAQFFDSTTEVRLEVATLSSSCVQAPQTSDPCTKVPEPDNTTATLIVGCLVLGVVSRLAMKG
ncbi:MAG: hypothetical protein QNJ41_06220 [Xenococcaceae cyanobacterium MO_188.B32]|nr:hypothetical protein [Xenococcaceae cyanobacterium MO_188.B32]